MSPKSVYRALLYCYPAAFRQEYGDQMLLFFDEQLRRDRPLRSLSLLLEAILDALTVAPKEHAHVILQDLRYAFRSMAASPAFTAVAILSLALGIGANTAIFSLWNGILHAPLPGVRQPRELVMLSNPNSAGMWTGSWDPSDGARAWLSFDEFQQLRTHASAFSALMASQSSLRNWRIRLDDGGWEEAHARLVSSNYFDFLGVKPAIGRLFSSPEDRPPALSAVISFNYWQRRFNGQPSVLGKSISFRHTVLTIAGVAPPGFFGETVGQAPDIWAPIPAQPSIEPGRDLLHEKAPTKIMWLHVFGRLAPGFSLPQAEAQANAIFHAGLETFYGAPNLPAVTPERQREYLSQYLRLSPAARGASPNRKEFSLSLTALLYAVLLLLLIACANLANLLLARGAARKPEIALRLSLGASRGRLIRQLLTENLALAAIGGFAGLLVARFFHAALVRLLARSDRGFRLDFSLDTTVLAFACAATFAAALLFGLLPAWQVTKTNAGAFLKEQSRATAAPGRMRFGRFLVSLQLALSLPLLFAAGLLVTTLYNLLHIDPGFIPNHLLLARLDPAPAPHPLLQHLRQLPGVQSASYSELGLFSGGESNSGVEVEGFQPKVESDRHSATDLVGPDYFATLGTRILLGRDILESDTAASPKVCVINDAFARHFFDGRNPIGMNLTAVETHTRTTYRIVGVAANAHSESLRDPVVPRFFLPSLQSRQGVRYPIFLLRTATDSSALAPAVGKAIREFDPLSIPALRSIEEQMAPVTAQDRTVAQLAAIFGLVALSLAAIGLYGVLAYNTARRSAEIALRMALGANSTRVIGLILRETITLFAAGLVAGAALSFAAARLLGARLYGVAPQDPLTLALAVALLLAAALVAAFLPARRASTTDPMTALRM